MKILKFFLIILVIFSLQVSFTFAEVEVRIKDIAKIAGLAENQLVGYGIVVGLTGTGDSTRTIMTAKSISNMLSQMGIAVSAQDMNSKNVAAVMVTAELPAFVRNGDTVDVTVASLGDSTNIQGGILLFTPLLAANGSVFGSAQGAVSIGGFNVTGGGGNKVTKNHTTVGRIPEGGLINQDFSSSLTSDNNIIFSLYEPDFTTARRVVTAINSAFGEGTAVASDPASVKVKIPSAYQGNPVEWISQIEELTLVPDNVAKVIINERTGTVVINQNVKLFPAAVAHGNISVIIRSEEQASQPGPFSSGETQTVVNTTIEVEEDTGNVIYLQESTSLQQVVDALNAIGATPRDLIAILQALKEAGALQAEVDIL